MTCNVFGETLNPTLLLHSTNALWVMYIFWSTEWCWRVCIACSILPCSTSSSYGVHTGSASAFCRQLVSARDFIHSFSTWSDLHLLCLSSVSYTLTSNVFLVFVFVSIYVVTFVLYNFSVVFTRYMWTRRNMNKKLMQFTTYCEGWFGCKDISQQMHRFYSFFAFLTAVTITLNCFSNVY